MSRTLSRSMMVAAGVAALGAASALGCGAGDAAPVVRKTAIIQSSSAPSTAMKATAKVTGIRDCVGNTTHQPRSITLSCADAGYQVVKLKWQNWGGKRAAATGIAVVNTCEPNCADGTFKRFTVQVVADRLTVGTTSAEYRRLTVVYSNARPTGIPARDVYRVTKRGPIAVS